MTVPKLAPYATLLLRLALGIMFLTHSIVLKWLTYGLPGTAQFFVSVGLPGWLAYAVFAAEIAGGAMLILGVQVRWAAAAMTPILLGAVWVHAGNGWVFTAANGGWEYPAYLTVLCIVQALLGEGAWALSPSRLPAFAPRALVRAVVEA
ncbi:membrane protein [Hypericibacter terrae]|uniref:Membrane protein n=1 Tax=Hypericibacter terrae TaxID=2602015 RepID=A0A5J6MJD2_9PROT|nr:DoxX family protein [Hypericibacter terrae]QEX17311.1 membrane protein [Hypericibacter terrae]